MTTFFVVLFLVAVIGILLALDLGRSWRDEDR